MFYSYFIENDGDYFIPNNCEGDFVLFITNEDKTKYVSIFSDGGLIGDNIWDENSESESVSIPKIFKNLYDKANKIFNSEYFDMLSKEDYKFTDEQTEMFIIEIRRLVSKMEILNLLNEEEKAIEKLDNLVMNHKNKNWSLLEGKYPFEFTDKKYLYGESKFKKVWKCRNHPEWYYFISDLGRVLLVNSKDINKEDVLKCDKSWIVPQKIGKHGNLYLSFEKFPQDKKLYNKLAWETTVYSFVEYAWLQQEMQLICEKFNISIDSKIDVHHINDCGCDNTAYNLILLPNFIHNRVKKSNRNLN